MFKNLCLRLSIVATLSFGFASTNQALAATISTDASVKVTRGGELKGKSTFALGSFRVAFVTKDAAVASTRGIFGSSAAKISAELVGTDRVLMQKIADAVYVEFLKQAAASGYNVIESSALAKTSPAYAALTPSENFSVGRLGTFVIPTGQRSVALASDARSQGEKGTAGFAARFNMISDQVAKTPAYEAFPVAAGQAGAPVLGVTIVVNFANFKGSGSLGGSKASLSVGATIDGRNKNEIVPSTSILGWDKSTESCAMCPAQFGLEGQIYSDAPIGSYDGSGAQNNQVGIVTVNPAAYESNVLVVASQAITLLIGAIAAER